MTPIEGAATSQVTDVATTPVGSPVDGLVIDLRERLTAAEHRAAEAEIRAAVAEAVARERGAALDAERSMVRALTAAPSNMPVPVASEPPPRRRWWHKRA